MYQFKKQLLTTLLVLIALCFTLVLPFVVIGSFSEVYGKVVLTAMILTYYIFLAHCCALVLGKRGASGFGIAGLITVGLSVIVALYLMWGDMNMGALGTFAMTGGLSYMWDVMKGIILVSFFSFAFAQVCLLLYITPRKKVVAMLRGGVLVVIGLTMLTAMTMLYALDFMLARVLSILYVLNIFGTIGLLILHERTKYEPDPQQSAYEIGSDELIQEN